MSVFENKQVENPQKEKYNFVTQDINSYIEELNQPKQDMPESAVDFSYFPEEEGEPTLEQQEERQGLKANTQVAKSTAKLAVTMIDNFIPEIMKFVSKAESSNVFKADEDIKNDLESAFAEYIKLKGVGDIPPGVMIVILLLIAYGSKVPMLLEIRKANIQAEKDKTEIDKLRGEIDFYKQQIRQKDDDPKKS